MQLEHGHTPEEIASRLATSGRGSHLRDAVYGGIDGAVTTFAIVAGVAGAGLSPTVILALGFANVFADGFSMAAGNYAGTKADLEDLDRIRAMEERHIDLAPDGEREELRQILAMKGLEGDVLSAAVQTVSSNRTAWVDLMLVDEHGRSPSLPNPMAAASTTFLAFLLAGLVPLMPFVIGLANAFGISIVATAAVFFAIGTMKSHWSLRSWWSSGAETLAIGGTAAAIAYFVGTLFHV